MRVVPQGRKLFPVAALVLGYVEVDGLAASVQTVWPRGIKSQRTNFAWTGLAVIRLGPRLASVRTRPYSVSTGAGIDSMWILGVHRNRVDCPGFETVSHFRDRTLFREQ